jgi:hypothetical protein
MMNLTRTISAVAFAFVLFFCSFSAHAQQQQPDPQQEAEAEKKLDEFIQTQIEKYNLGLKLEHWQVFYLDSIMTHDYHAMQDELKTLSSSKVSNTDIYIRTQDKWADQMYNSFKGVLNKSQWEKYLKMGAARDAKAREKRKARNAGK